MREHRHVLELRGPGEQQDELFPVNELVHFNHGAPDADPEVRCSARVLQSALAWEQGVTTSQPGQQFSGRTIWIRKLKTPLRAFLRTETGGASVLLSAAIAALVWVNVDASSYDALWGTRLSIDVGGAGLALELRHWVNSGLMTFFFFVVGLEARREFDLGELRERKRFAAAAGRDRRNGDGDRYLPRLQHG